MNEHHPEQHQAALLEAYIAACRQNADAPVPEGLDPEMAAFVRQLLRHKPAHSQDERASDQRPFDERPLRERIWANALTAANAAPHAPDQLKNPTFSPNGHHKSLEKEMLLTESESIMVLPVPTSMRRPRRAITSPSLLTVAATLALVFMGVLAMLRLNNGDDDQFGAGIVQNETPTPMETAIETPPNTPESDIPPTTIPTNADEMPPTPVETAPPTPAPTNDDALPPTPAPTSTPFPTSIIRMPPTLVPTSTPIPFSGETRPQPCMPTEVPTITPPDWPTPTSTPIGMVATPVPMDATPIDCLMPTPIPVCQVVVTSAEGARLRSLPSAVSALLAPAPQGQPMTVILQETGDDGRAWYLVEFDIDGIRVMGYVREDSIRAQVGSICPPPTPTLIPLTALPPTLPPTLARPMTGTPTALPPTLVRPMTNTPTMFPSTREATATPTPLR